MFCVWLLLAYQIAVVRLEEGCHLHEAECLRTAVQKGAERGVGGNRLIPAGLETVALDVADDGGGDLRDAGRRAAAKEGRHPFRDVSGGEVLVVGGGVATAAAEVGALCLGEVNEHIILGRVEGAAGLRPSGIGGRGRGICDGNWGTEVPGDEALNWDPDVRVRGGADDACSRGLPVRLQGCAVCGVDAAGGIVVFLCD